MLIFINKVYKNIRKIFDIHCAINLDSFYYNSKKKCFIIIFRIQNRSLSQKLNVENAFFDKNLLNQLHSTDAYKIGIIFGMYKNKIIINDSDYVLSRQHHFKLDPMYQIKGIPLTENDSDIIINLINTDYEFIVNLNDIQNKPFLIYGLPPTDAALVGLLVSEYFIKNYNIVI